jgi:hypothetical protein
MMMYRGMMYRGMMYRGMMYRGMMYRGMMYRGMMYRGMMYRGAQADAAPEAETGLSGDGPQRFKGCAQRGRADAESRR